MDIMQRPDVQAWIQTYKMYIKTQGNGGGNPQGGPPQNGFSTSADMSAVNRNGNAASTSAVGGTARTPDALSANSGVMQQARERAAKRIGRNVSQSGISSIPSLARQSKYRAGY